MPTYEYACRDCGEHLEVVQSFKDDALTTCPNCDGSLRKVFSAAGIIFKGSGWHVKDYASKGASTSTTASTSDTSGDSSTSGSSSESSSSSSSSSSEGSGSSTAESA
jgi:putative FmdB family regulatory protein